MIYQGGHHYNAGVVATGLGGWLREDAQTFCQHLADIGIHGGEFVVEHVATEEPGDVPMNFFVGHPGTRDYPSYEFLIVLFRDFLV